LRNKIFQLILITFESTRGIKPNPHFGWIVWTGPHWKDIWPDHKSNVISCLQWKSTRRNIFLVNKMMISKNISTKRLCNGCTMFMSLWGLNSNFSCCKIFFPHINQNDYFVLALKTPKITIILLMNNVLFTTNTCGLLYWLYHVTTLAKIKA
jgi:hypothetical protein